jgi:hypothetical protein
MSKGLLMLRWILIADGWHAGDDGIHAHPEQTRLWPGAVAYHERRHGHRSNIYPQPADVCFAR